MVKGGTEIKADISCGRMGLLARHLMNQVE